MIGIEVLESLPHQLLLPQILALPRRNGRYTLDTDALDKQDRSVLVEEQPERSATHVVYWSPSLHKAEQAFDKMTLGISRCRMGCHTVDRLSQKSWFTFRTYHEELWWIRNMKEASENQEESA